MEQFCVFGDSIAKGVVYDNIRQKYVLAKACCANLFSRATGFVVKNYAKFGSTITRGREIFNKHIHELRDYSCVVLEFGGNDCDFYWDQVSEDPGAAHLPHVPLAQFEREYGDLIDDTQAHGGVPVLLTIPPIYSPNFFNWISRGLSADNILRWLGGDAWFTYRWHETYNSAVCRLAVKKRVPLVDIRQAFLCKVDYADYLCEDGMHPNDRGHALINEILCERWNQLSA
jgi:lysophospholipase L1-like esterase